MSRTWTVRGWRMWVYLVLPWLIGWLFIIGMVLGLSTGYLQVRFQ